LKPEFDSNAQWLLKFLETYGDIYQYQIIRTCCAKVNKELVPVGTTIRFDFDKIAPSPATLWESESLIITETHASGSASDTMKQYTKLEKIPFLDNEIEFSNIPETLTWRCNVYNHSYWKTPMYDITGTAELQTSWNIDLNKNNRFANRIATEIGFHDKQALRSWEIPGLYRDFGIDIDSDFRYTKINILFPLLGRIEDSFVSKSKLAVKGNALVDVSDKLNLIITTHWSDGTITQERRDVNVQTEGASRIGSWMIEISLVSNEKNALAVYIVLNLDKGFQVDATRHIVSVSPDAPINMISELDSTFVGGKIFSDWGKSENNVQKRIMQFEYFVSTLFNVIGLPTIWLGPHDQSGIDLISFDFSTGRVYSLECTTGAPRKKASLILQSRKKLSELLPTRKLTTIMVSSKTVSDADRKDLGESEVHVIDADNLMRIIELAKEGKRGSDILREVGVSESIVTW
jgi:hypothetical protein